MIRLLFILIALSIIQVSPAQGFIGLSKEKVKKGLDSYVAKNQLSAVIDESPFTTTLFIDAPSGQKTEFIYHFDSGGRCRREVRISCDSCIVKYIAETLATKDPGWKKLNERQYISKYSKRLLLEIDQSSTTVRQVQWNRDSYNEIIRRGRM